MSSLFQELSLGLLNLISAFATVPFYQVAEKPFLIDCRCDSVP